MNTTHDDALPVTVLLPDTAAQPITVYDGGAALRMAIVERDGVHALGPDWERPGVYVLLDMPAPDGTWGCYPGQATSLRKRLVQHVSKKDHWRRALLVTRDTTFGFNSAQIGWLEGRLYDLLDAAGDAVLHNGNRPSDETLPAHERLALEAAVAPVRRVLRLIGYDPVSPDDQTALPSPSRQTSKFYGITVQHLIAAGLLAGGETLTSTNGAWPATALLLPDGKVQTGGHVYATPSAAATAVKDGPANGWEFWAVDTPTGQVTLATLRARYLDDPRTQITGPTNEPR
ncbi:MAG: hypothetical protein NVSMB55_00640 [Mycobacteriales bacterium]